MARERGIKRPRDSSEPSDPFEDLDTPETFEVGSAGQNFQNFPTFEGKGEEKKDDEGGGGGGGGGRRPPKSIFLPSESVFSTSQAKAGGYIWRCVPSPFSHECVRQPASSSSSSSSLSDPNRLRWEKNGQIYYDYPSQESCERTCTSLSGNSLTSIGTFLPADAMRNLRIATGLNRPISRELAFINAKNLQRKKLLDGFMAVVGYYEKLHDKGQDLSWASPSPDFVANYSLLRQLCETIKSGQLDLFSESISHFIIDTYSYLVYPDPSPLDQLILCLLQTAHNSSSSSSTNAIKRWKIATADRLRLLKRFVVSENGQFALGGPIQSWKVALQEGLLSDISEQERKTAEFQLLAAAMSVEIFEEYGEAADFLRSGDSIDFWVFDALFPLLDVRYFDRIFITNLWILATTVNYKFVKDFIALLLRNGLPLTPEMGLNGYASQSPILNLRLKMLNAENEGKGEVDEEVRIEDTPVVTAQIIDDLVERFLLETDPENELEESIADFLVGLQLLLSQPYYSGKVTLDQVLNRHPKLRTALNLNFDSKTTSSSSSENNYDDE